MRYVAYWGSKSNIVFIGDSRIRQLYFSFVQFIGNDVVTTSKAHSDLQFRDAKMNVQVVCIFTLCFI